MLYTMLTPLRQRHESYSGASKVAESGAGKGSPKDGKTLNEHDSTP